MDGTGELFAGFVAALGDGVEAIVVSYPVERALDYRALTQFARGHLPQDRPWFLLGESFSGPIAIALAAAKPPGLLGLILCCSFARNPVPFSRRLPGLANYLPVSARLTCLVAPLLLGRHPLPQLRRVLERVTAPVLRMRLREVLKVDYSAEMAMVSVPVLYLQASGDRVVPASAVRHVASLCPALQVAPLPGPHLLLQAMPAEAVAAVRRFIFSCIRPAGG